MATNAEAILTREGLILVVMQAISAAEGKSLTIPGSTSFDRAYVLDLVRDAAEAVDGKRLRPRTIDPAVLSQI